MTISLVNGIAGAQVQQATQKTTNKLESAIRNLVSATRSNEDVAALSVAAKLQSAVSGLTQVSGNLAQAASLTQVADSGLTQIQDALGKLQSLAQQASSAVSPESRAALNDQFQKLASQIDNIAQSTSFNGQKLLNGDLSGQKAVSLDSLLSLDGTATGGGDLSIPSVTTSALFDGKSLNLSTPQDAQQAFAVIGDSLNQVTSLRATTGSFQTTLDFAAANVQSAVVNQEAARSELQDTDFLAAATQNSQASLQQNVAIAVAVQTKNLNPALLKLIG